MPLIVKTGGFKSMLILGCWTKKLYYYVKDLCLALPKWLQRQYQVSTDDKVECLNLPLAT